MYILDAGGGNGFDSIPLAERGHRVEIVDYSHEMLDDAQKYVIEAGLQEDVHLHHADLREIPRLFPDEKFDLALCHNVLQYVENVPALLHNLILTIQPSGFISLVSINRFSGVYAAAFLRGNLVDALASIDARTTQGILFDTH